MKNFFIHTDNYQAKEQSELVNIVTSYVCETSEDDCSMLRIDKPLSVSQNIFSELDDVEISDSRILDFVREFKEIMSTVVLDSNCLSNLKYNIDEEGTIDIDWIHSYHRVFFSFRNDRHDSYGKVLSDIKGLRFSSDLNPLNDYPACIKDAINFTLANILG